MKINKQLFEDVLLDKLEGVFVLKNGHYINSDKLHKSPNPYYEYMLKDFYFPYGYWYYDENGTFSYTSFYSGKSKDTFTIVDFIITKEYANQQTII